MLFCTDRIESIEWPRSCTTTAYRWLSLDSHPSLGTSWSAVIKSPNFSARSRASRVRLLQGALCYFGSQADVAVSVFREVRKMLCFQIFVTTFVGRSKSDSRELCASADISVSTRLSWKSSNGSSASFLSSLRDSFSSLLVACPSLRSNTKSEDELAAALFPETRDWLGIRKSMFTSLSIVCSWPCSWLASQRTTGFSVLWWMRVW